MEAPQNNHMSESSRIAPVRRRAACFTPFRHRVLSGSLSQQRSRDARPDSVTKHRNRAEATAGTGVGGPAQAAALGTTGRGPAPAPPTPPSRPARVPVRKLRSARRWGSGTCQDRRPPGLPRPHDPQSLPPNPGSAARSVELRWRRRRGPGPARNPKPQKRWQPRSSPGRLRSAPRPRPPLS